MSAGNDLAFPGYFEDGLTKREYFAAKIMAQIASDGIHQGHRPSETAGVAVELADALIAALNKPAETGGVK